MKFFGAVGGDPICASHPVRGEWIEIQIDKKLLDKSTSHPVRGEWIEILLTPSTSGEICCLTP